MAPDKITITDKLRFDIIERRKNRGISSYELSERTGNGHSKFWLQNIESGKTKKITKQDLISLYMAMEKDDDEDYVTFQIERILNQSISDTSKEWYELVNISENYSENYDDDSLMEELDALLEDKIVDEIRCAVFGMSVNQKQAALTALQNFHYSLYKNSDLAFALINIPIYGIKDHNKQEYNEAINDLLAIGAKYNDLVIKNNSMETIKSWNEYDEYYAKIDQQTIHTALKNFKDILQQILDASNSDNPDMFNIVKRFNTDVSFMIERGQPNVLKHYLKSFHIYDGKGFSKHIEDCVKWFLGFEHEFNLPFIYDVIDKELLKSVYTFLDNFGDIRPSFKI